MGKALVRVSIGAEHLDAAALQHVVVVADGVVDDDPDLAPPLLGGERCAD